MNIIHSLKVYFAFLLESRESLLKSSYFNERIRSDQHNDKEKHIGLHKTLERARILYIIYCFAEEIRYHSWLLDALHMLCEQRNNATLPYVCLLYTSRCV